MKQFSIEEVMERLDDFMGPAEHIPTEKRDKAVVRLDEVFNEYIYEMDAVSQTWAYEVGYNDALEAMGNKQSRKNENKATAIGPQNTILEKDMREALRIIDDLTNALGVLHIRLYGLEGVAGMGDFAMQAEADCGAASKMFFSLSESLRDESERAENAVNDAVGRRKQNKTMQRVYTEMQNKKAAAEMG